MKSFTNDPRTEFIAPPRAYAGNRDFFVFIDTGENGLCKLAITGYSEESLKRFFESPDEPRPAEKVLPERYPQYSGGRSRSAMASSVAYNAASRMTLITSWLRKLGADAAQRFVPAADLIEEYLDTRIPEEFETYKTYKKMVELTDSITRCGLCQ